LGIGSGTEEFDLYDISIDTARYVKIIDDDDGNPYELNPGADIDAIQSLKTPITPSEPPSIPDIDGPNNGKVGSEYNFTIMSLDPEGKQVYYFIDWGDGINSDWIGPYSSGELVDINHVWTEEGDFEIKAKAKDIDNVQSAWSSPHLIHIDAPLIDIDKIFGGLFKVSSIIKNNGGVDANNVEWEISLDGGAFIGKKTQGAVSIPAYGEATITSKLIIGFGPTIVTVSVEIPETFNERSQGGFVYFLYIQVNPGG
jgi:hypothetical protein